MLNWWLATISLCGFLITSIILVLYGLKAAVNSEDSYRVDPLPTEDSTKNKK
ncbi:hypothetical protein [Metabacillus litoralis]|uniref:hypothetical protein n=1 Tax=Metabacillus TaxID=2675233 RepID=UPI0013CF2C18|nr:hypothetical protein [Metabacillus litoralis]MCM3165043.1 hypothetical protein [Metabacillus litoralis]MCM3412238.1 hypothetical protein [Metabacillus litoralis]